MNVGIIGAGWAAGEHCKTLARAPGTTVVAVADPDVDRAQALALEHDARAYRAGAEMIAAEALDVVVVASPPGSHRESAVDAIEAGLGVFIEKPLARTIEDANAIAAAALRGGTVCAVGYQWRAVAALDLLTEELSRQELRLLSSEGIGITQARHWFLDAGQSGRLISERGSHHIDLQRRVGGEVAAVQAMASRVGMRDLRHEAALEDGTRFETGVTLTLTFESGALGSVQILWVPEGYPSRHRLTVHGTDSSYELDLDPRFSLRELGGERTFQTTPEDPFAAGLLRFLDAVERRDPSGVFCTPDDAAGTVAVISACERALASGQTVAVERPDRPGAPC